MHWLVVLLVLGLWAPLNGRAQSFAAAVDFGTVTTPEITEASGIAASRQNPGVLWTHNDSSFAGSIFALSTNGTYLARYYIPSVFFGNFEDIAIGPGASPEHHYVYLADIGDNFATRPSVRVLRFPEPAVYPYFSNSPPVLPLTAVQEIELTYPDKPYDAEALMIDPLTGDLFIATKETNSARIYMTTRAKMDAGGPIQLTFVRELSSGNGLRSVAAGDISFDGRLICMRRNGRAWTWARSASQTVSNALASTGTTQPVATAPEDLNGEAIGFHATGLGYFTISEGSQQPINYFRRTGSGLPTQPVVFIGRGEVWRYNDQGTDEGTAWRGTNFNDSAWASGPAQLGYGQADQQTVISYGFDEFEKNVTTYFRKQFTRPSAVTNLALRVCFTDGIAVYLNGTEVFRRNLAPNAAYDELATGSNAERQNFWVNVPVTPTLLRAGTNNFIAVELHRQIRWQYDLSFDLQLVQASVELPARFSSPPAIVGGAWRANVTGPIGSVAEVEASSDLQTWSLAGQVSLPRGTNFFQEAISSGGGHRFFRVRN
ncbi:MAG: hypothetical protein IPK15_15900 [Verrucomicrobia bacterium]|nr:hypothetical protein [Verrucomicrobiota bacterium]